MVSVEVKRHLMKKVNIDYLDGDGVRGSLSVGVWWLNLRYYRTSTKHWFTTPYLQVSGSDAGSVSSSTECSGLWVPVSVPVLVGGSSRSCPA